MAILLELSAKSYKLAPIKEFGASLKGFFYVEVIGASCVGA